MTNTDLYGAGARLCCNCRHYYQHYVKCGDYYSETNCGHCARHRVSERKPNSTCIYFEV